MTPNPGSPSRGSRPVCRIPPGRGSVEEIDIYPDLHERMLAAIDADAIRPLRSWPTAATAAGPTVGALLDRLSLDVTTSRWEPTATSPRPAQTLSSRSNAHAVKQVKKQGVDLAIAWSSGADRCFFVDDGGTFSDGDFVCALLARATLAKEPGPTILCDPARASSSRRGRRGRRQVRSEPRRPRLLQAPDAGEGRGVGGEVFGRYSSGFSARPGPYLPCSCSSWIRARAGRAPT